MPPPAAFSPWTERLVHLLHDPPGKLRYLARHKQLAKQLADELAGIAFDEEDWDNLLVPRPDRAAAGADRPCVPWGIRQAMSRAETLIATHPLGDLAVCPPIQLGHADGGPVAQRGDPRVGKREREDQRAAARTLAHELVGADAKLRYYAVWRRLRDELITGRDPEWAQPESHPRGDLFWSMLPADSRCPDVTIWDHTRVTAALAFMNGPAHEDLPDERAPYLLKMSLTPVQPFIGMARTSRDLWLGSMLLAELAFQAMTPFIEQYGPTCILYPDLRANPRMDLWLTQQGLGDALPKRAHDPTSFAALVPSTFVAVVPRGRAGDAELPPLDDLARQADRRVKEAWTKIQHSVRAWLESSIGASPHWQAIWDRQHRAADVIRTRWVAVPWLPGGKQDHYRFGPIFPFSDPSLAGPMETPSDAGVRRARETRMLPWVPAPLWQLSEATRAVFGRTNKGILHSERGFDFAVTHAMLRAVHDARKQVSSWPNETAELGVKCTLCGQRSALTDAPDGAGPHGVDSLTARARGFWSRKALDPDRTGAERLCAICAMRRFAVEADAGYENFNQLWATQADKAAMHRDAGAKPRVPFPSTSAVAAQDFLLELVRRATPEVIAKVRRVVDEHDQAQLTQTQFPRALVRLALAEAIARERDPSGALAAFLRIEPQECVYPDALHAQLAMRTGAPTSSPLVGAVRDLLKIAHDQLSLPPPGSRIAVVKVDGDSLGPLIDGDPDAIGARWSDVLHPETRKKILANPTCQESGWPLLADLPRMTGPSLHAFISRALGEFTHRIVPWVLECEFSGRLLYAGGDDVLALVPVDQALDLAARLQQLYSAHWVIDTQHEADAWAWRRAGEVVASKLEADLEAARGRFVIPLPALGDSQLAWPPAWRAPHTTDARLDQPVAVTAAAGPVIPMLASRQSLSAGIVYANMKDGLGGLVREAGSLLDKDAKGIQGKAAVAVADRSRGGTKRSFAIQWSPSGRTALGVPVAHQLMRRVANAFAQDLLPARLPYKLRAVAQALAPIFDARPARILAPGVGEARLLRNSIEANLEQAIEVDVLDAVEALWLAGWRTRRVPGAGAAEPGSADHTLDGLLIALSLAEEEI
jgi:CRISPR-associated protein Cmr2